jgi:hypothetical protein
MECSKKLSHATAPLNEPSDQIDLLETNLILILDIKGSVK